MLTNITAITPLGDSIDGTRRRRRMADRKQWATAVEGVLHPLISAHLAAARVDLLRVQVISDSDVVIHNGREWRGR